MPVYAGMYFVAMSTLVFELTLARMLSVITWYHLSFFAISIAMLGMTAGAVAVFLRASAFTPETVVERCRRWTLAYAASIPLALLAICYLPVDRTVIADAATRTVFNMLVITLATAVPFFLGGTVISALLSRSSFVVNRLYAVDLVGAASGCLVVLAGLSVLDAPSVALAAAVLALVAAACFGGGRVWLRCLLIAALGLAVVLASNHGQWIKPQLVKGGSGMSVVDVDRWNSFSRVMVSPEATLPPAIWGGDRRALAEMQTPQRLMNIDGAAGTVMRAYRQREDIEHLRYDVTNVAYFLRPSGGAAVIGIGGGKDIQSALLFGHERVLGVELNPIFIDLLEDRFADFAGIGGDPRVEMVVDEARSYFSHQPETFALLQMSLIDTWAATGAGAFSLSENGLYTIEAWRTFMQRLDADGIFTVSRWYSQENLGETGRAMSLAVATLLAEGVAEPDRHIALVVHAKIATLLLSRAPLTGADLAALDAASAQYGHSVVLAPGRLSGNPLLDRITQARDMAELERVSADSGLNMSPPTDLSPYFFNMLKLDGLLAAVRGEPPGEGVVAGNIAATVTLVYLIGGLALLTVLFVLLPLFIHSRRYASKERLRPSYVLFFCLIGAAFMALEIGMLQRLSVFLGHPIYALGILLFGIILSTGLGSWLSETLNLGRRRHALALSAATAMSVLLLHSVLGGIIERMMTEAIGLRILVSLALIIPLGLLLGCFFPTGMTSAKASNSFAAPWYWGLNGIFGVLFSALAVFISIYISIAVNFYIAAALYLLTGLCFYRMLDGREAAASA